MPRGRALLVLPLLLLLSAAALAQTTRVESIADQQAAKAKQLGTEGPPDAELVVRRVLRSPLLSGDGGAYPWFGSVFGGSGMSIGAGYLKRLQNAASINVLAGISVNASVLLEARLAAPELWRGRIRVDADAKWTDARDVSFYGFGPGSNQVRLRYNYQPTDLTGNVTFTPATRLSFAGGYSFMNIDTASESPVLIDAIGHGLGEGLRYNVTRAGLAYDWRAAPGYSTRGGLYRATWERYHETNNFPYSFDLQEYEVSQLVPLVREQFVLAVRGLVTLTNTTAGNEVPVMLSPYLGSGSTLRAFPTRRFTDRNRVLLTGEYRWRPSRYLDMALLVDAGQVQAGRRDFQIRDFEVNWGIGARFHGPTFTAFRVELVRGREGVNVVFAGSQIF